MQQGGSNCHQYQISIQFIISVDKIKIKNII